MKRVFAGFLLFLGLVGSVLAQSAENWTKFESKDGNFMAEFPAAPKVSKNVVDDPAGKRDYFWTQVLTNRYYFSVGYTDYRVLPVEKDKIKANLDFFERQYVEGFGGKLKASRDVGTGELKGREIVLDKIGERSVVRTFIDGKRVFTNIVTMRVEDFERPEMAAMASKFFESFKVKTARG